MSHLFLLAAVYNCLAAMVLWINTPVYAEADKHWPTITLRHWSSRFFVGAILWIFAVLYLYCFSLESVPSTFILTLMGIKLVGILSCVAEARYHKQPLEDYIPILMVNSLFTLMFSIAYF